MANTTWNPSDKAVGITLSGSNLIATNSNNNVCIVRAAHAQSTGKFYWEYTYNTLGSNTGAGIAKAIIATNISCGNSVTGSAATGSCILNAGGAIIIDGSGSGVSFGAITNGTIVGIALDLTARRIWFRLGAAGNWNVNASYDPATNVGGLALPNIGYGIPAFPAANVNNTGNQITANFGDTAFTGAVPSGFTSGWPTGSSPTNALASQASLEQFYATNPDNQTTQTALEMWATTATISGQNLVTQVALEMWAQSTPAIVPQARVMILS